MGNNVVTLQYWRMSNVNNLRPLDGENPPNRASQTLSTRNEAPDESRQHSTESCERRISEGVGSRSIHHRWRNKSVANKANRYRDRGARNLLSAVAYNAKRKARITQLRHRFLDAEGRAHIMPNSKPCDQQESEESSSQATHHTQCIGTSVLETVRRPNRKGQRLLDIHAFRAMYQAKVARLQRKLLDAEPLQTFSTNCDKVMADWNLLKSETMISVYSSSDPCIIRSFRAIDLILSGRQGSSLLRRLASVHLVELLSFLELVISYERDSGHMVRERSYSNASIAIDIYMSAQEDDAKPDGLRRQLKERKRVGAMWKRLSEPSPLLVLMYSEAAEAIVEDPERTNVWTLRSAAAKIMKECPSELLSRLYFAG